MRPELLKGHLDALLLAVLESGPQHGYAVIDALRDGSAGTTRSPRSWLSHTRGGPSRGSS
jgi:DNA-binding PadR family transcriptional regulator